MPVALKSHCILTADNGCITFIKHPCIRFPYAKFFTISISVQCFNPTSVGILNFCARLPQFKLPTTGKSIRCPTWLWYIASGVYDKVAIILHYHLINVLIRTSIKIVCHDPVVLRHGDKLPIMELSSIAIEYHLSPKEIRSLTLIACKNNIVVFELAITLPVWCSSASVGHRQRRQ